MQVSYKSMWQLSWMGMLSLLVLASCGLPLAPLPPETTGCIVDVECGKQHTCIGGVCVRSGELPGTKEQGPDAIADAGKEHTTLPEESTRETMEPLLTDSSEPPVETRPEPPPLDLPPCTNGATQTCYTGPIGTRGKGLCKDGKQTCQAGQWSSCVGSVVPGNEVCDGKDNNCDGSIDEGLTKECYSGPVGTDGKGICAKGTATCESGAWKCKGDILPQKEVCDGKDNDCDGQTDEPDAGCQCSKGQKRACGPVVKGTCKKGTQTCSADGKWGPCVGAVHPTTETCDGKDNDCDGSIDESVTRPCYTGSPGTAGRGECKQGFAMCVNGKYSACKGQIVPRIEVCDGKDNDCDGAIDENAYNVGKACPVTGQKGPCRAGVFVCSRGVMTCQQTYVAKPETCNNKDDDCDGIVDSFKIPNVVCNVPGKAGECAKGAQYCVNGGRQCRQVVFPSGEVCDGKDTNCDGRSDACAQGAAVCSGNFIKKCSNDCESIQIVTCSVGCLNGVCCACKPGQTRCTSNRNIQEVCKSDCTGYQRSYCPNRHMCIVGHHTKCTYCQCSPGIRSCTADNKGLTVCKADCSGHSYLQACPNGKRCINPGPGQHAYCQ